MWLRALSRISHDGVEYLAGDRLEVTAAQGEQLIYYGAAEPAPDPPAEAQAAQLAGLADRLATTTDALDTAVTAAKRKK